MNINMTFFIRPNSANFIASKFWGAQVQNWGQQQQRVYYGAAQQVRPRLQRGIPLFVLSAAPPFSLPTPPCASHHCSELLGSLLLSPGTGLYPDPGRPIYTYVAQTYIYVRATPPFTLPPPPCASHHCSIPCLSPRYIPTQVGNSPIYPPTTSLFSYPQGQGYSPSISLLPTPLSKT